MTAGREQRLDAAVAALRRGDARSAGELCRALLAVDDGDAEAWSLLGMALLGEDTGAALQALAEAVRLQPTEPRWHLHRGLGLGRAGRPAEAERACHEAVTRSGGDVQTLEPWADSLAALGRLPEAVSVLRRAADLRPAPATLQKLSHWLTRSGDCVGAIDAIRRAHGGGNVPPPDELRIARLEMHLQRYDDARSRLERLQTLAPDLDGVAATAAELARWRGDFGRADDILRAALERSPDDAALLHALLENASRIDDDLLASAQRRLRRGDLPVPGRRALAFALARHHDRRGDAEQAWALACEANGLVDDDVAFDAGRHHRRLERALALFDATPAPDAAAAPTLIYLVGPPRSGATLLQTVIASAPGVASVGERGALLPWLLPLLDEEAGTAARLWQARRGELRDADLAGLRALHPQAQSCVDKTPHHAHVLGLLWRIHPGARFVDTRRSPAEVALSIFFHDFPPAFDYSRRLEDIVEYLRLRAEAVRRWRDAGVPLLSHDHDRFVADPPARGRDLLSALELPWHDGYLDASQRRAVVQTFSVQQVRETIAPAASRAARYASWAGERLAPLAALASQDPAAG